MPGLRELAEADLGIIINDTYGFGWSITVTNPAGLSVPDLKGFTNDISQLIDPDTGQAVSGRLATVAIRITDLINASLALPESIVDTTSKPWVIEFNDINGNAYKFKVNESNPDRGLGMVVCLLELYNAP